MPRAAAEVLEEAVAVVADRLILRSEWEAQLMLHAMQNRLDVNSPAVRDTIGAAVLEQMINDQLILIQAERDTTLRVESAEVDAALEERISEIRARFGSEQEYRAALARENLTERDLRVRYRPETRNYLLKQKLIQRKLAEVAVSHGEVREFFNRFSDSLPVQPEAIKLAHILLAVELNPAVVDSARERLTGILREIQNGRIDFTEAARRYSQDASASAGGDLGWFGPGEMVDAFEKAVFALSPGQLSGIVRSPLGWHLIQCMERAGDRVHARHILLSLAPTPADSARVRAVADSVGAVARDGGDFCALATAFSGDEESRRNCGELGWYPVEQMYPEFRAALHGVAPGAVVGPIATDFGWHILRVLDHRDARRLDITQDWDAIKQMARQEKTNRVVSDWIAAIRKDTYVSVRPLSGSVTIPPSPQP